MEGIADSRLSDEAATSGGITPAISPGRSGLRWSERFGTGKGRSPRPCPPSLKSHRPHRPKAVRELRKDEPSLVPTIFPAAVFLGTELNQAVNPPTLLNRERESSSDRAGQERFRWGSPDETGELSACGWPSQVVIQLAENAKRREE